MIVRLHEGQRELLSRVILVFLIGTMLTLFLWPRKVSAQELTRLTSNQVRLEVDKSKCVSPCTARVKITVQAHKDNYFLTIGWGDVDNLKGFQGVYSLSLSQTSPNEFEHEILGIPESNLYIFVALYRRPKGKPFAEVDTWLLTESPQRQMK